MKICFVTTYFNENRGGGKVFADLFRSLQREHNFFILTTKDTAINPIWQTKIVKTRRSSRFYNFSDHLFSKAAVKSFKKIKDKKRFDLILINQVIGLPILKFKNFGIPVIYIIHHPVSADIDLATNESSGIKEKFLWKLRYFNMLSTQKKLVHGFDNTVTVSEASKSKIVNDYKVEPSRIKVIFNGINTDFFRKIEPTFPRSILALGSYQHPRRGFKYLKKVYSELSKINFTIFDVGRRTKEQSLELKKIKGIRQYSVIENNKLPEFYSRALIFISTSLYEGFGLSIAESLACETPAVAFGVGGVNDVLNKIDPHLICEPRNVKEMVEKVIKLSEDKDLGQKGEKYRQLIIDNFSLDKMAGNYDKFFEQIVSSKM